MFYVSHFWVYPMVFFLPKPKCCAEVGQLAAGEIVHVLEAATAQNDTLLDVKGLTGAMYSTTWLDLSP